MTDAGEHFDAIVIGSGFAGAVTACRLSQAGLNVCIVERGRRYAGVDLPTLPDETFWPRTDDDRAERQLPDFNRAFWQLGQGLWELRDLGDLVVGQAAGFGGGSLIYANVHLRAPDDVFDTWPEEYRAEKLRKYYDLAAWMLDVQRMPERFPKTAGLERAAKRLERVRRGLANGTIGDIAEELGKDPVLENEEPTHPRVIRTPLAVNFGTEGPNRFGAQQGSCDMRGECIFGCTRQAKNTLDLNYLHLAEEHGAEVRTLAEVTAIKLTDGSPRYEVVYRNHLKRGQTEVVGAQYVFLCAGAVNSTELLLRCQGEHLPIAGTGLGTKFYPNVDELGVVFGCKEEQETDRGPTITTAWLYDGKEDGTWLMVQDGGLPAHLEPMLGLFRSPLWMQRNAFAQAMPEVQTALPQRTGYATLPVDSIVDLLTGLTGSALAGNLPLSHEVSRSLSNFARGGRDLKRIPERLRWTLCPPQLRTALERVRTGALADLALWAEPIVEDFIDATTERMPDGLVTSIREMGLVNFEIGNRSESDLRKWALQAGIQGIWGSQAGLLGSIASVLSPLFAPAPKEVLQWAADLLCWALDYRGGDGHTTVLLAMGRDSKPARLELVREEIVVGSRIHDRDDAAGILVHQSAGVYVVSHVEGSFAVGEPVFADSRPIGICKEVRRGNLDIGSTKEEASQREGDCPSLCVLIVEKEDAGDVRRFRSDRFREGEWETAVRACEVVPWLRARLPAERETPERATQELLLRDLAQALGGELRTSPLYPFLGRRITVHAQGGCPMALEPKHGVTKPSGEVFGCDGLYVMDAAAFPTPVGVNPSATITAVAEWKVETFISAWLEKPHREVEERADKDWNDRRSGVMDDAMKWAADNKWLDPINVPELRAAPASPPPINKPIGIEFREVMIGTHRQFVGRRRFDAGPECFIETNLTARIDDLAIFLAGDRDDTGRELCVTGHVDIDLDDGFHTSSYPVDPDTSRIWLRAATDDCGHQTRSIEYLLEFVVGDDRYQLDGIKDIRDDARFDVWEDTTTLCFVLRKRSEMEHRKRGDRGPEPWTNDESCRGGVLRLPASQFFGTQIPTLRAINVDDDPARQAWAITTFARFFFSQLVDVYVPALERVADIGKRVLGRGHV